jgi:hypothetical protein
MTWSGGGEAPLRAVSRCVGVADKGRVPRKLLVALIHRLDDATLHVDDD